MRRIQGLLCRTRLWLAVVLLGVPMALLAQVTPLTSWVSTTFTITINHPRDASDGAHIDCAPGQPNCRLFNLASCSEPGLPINFTLGTPATTQASYTGTNQVVYAFLSQQASCTFSTVSGQTGNNPNLLIGTASSLAGSSVFFSGGTSGFNFPTNLSSFNASVTSAQTTGQVTTSEILAAMGVCPPNTASNQSIWYLCVGLDADGSQGVNNGSTGSNSSTTGTTSGGSDPVAYLQFQVDTLPPSAPTLISAKPLNGRATLIGTFDSSEPDVYNVTAFYTNDAVNLAQASNDPNDPNAASDGNADSATSAYLPCDQWSGAVGSKTVSVYGQAANQLTLELDGLENGTTYGVCLRAVDYLQNLSDPSPSVALMPRFECDLFTCYPDSLHVGWCGGPAVPSLWIIVGGSLLGRLLWRRPRRRRRRCASLVVGAVGLCAMQAQASEIDDIASSQPNVERAADEGHELDRYEHGQQQTRPTFAGDDLDINAPHGEFDHDSRTRRIQEDTFVTLDDASLDFGPEREQRVRWGAGLQLGPYRPTFTTRPVGAQTYNAMYAGKSLFSRRPVSVALTGEYYIFRRFGLVGPYLRVGFWQNSAPSRVCFAADGITAVPCSATTIDASVRGNDSQALVVVPLSLGAVWRFDELARRTRVPLTLHGRITLDNHLWWGRSGGHAALYHGHTAWGGTWGYTLAAGIAMNFNRLAQGRPRGGGDARIEYHLVAEYALVRGSALFGPARTLRVDFTDDVFVTLGLLTQFR